MKKNMRISLVADHETKSLLESMAAKAGSTLTEFLFTSGIFYGQLDPEFVREIKRTADLMGVRVTSLLQCLVTNQIAQAKAFQTVFGRSSKSLERIFRWKDGQLIAGDQLLAILNEEYEAIFRTWSEHLVDLHENGKEFQVTDEAVEFLAGSIESEAQEMRV